MTFKAWDPLLWPNKSVVDSFMDLSNQILESSNNFIRIIGNETSFVNAVNYTDSSWIEIFSSSNNLESASGKGGPCTFGDFSEVLWVNSNYSV